MDMEKVMVIVSKGIVEHVEAIKSAFATSGLIMGTPSTTNFSMNSNLNNATIPTSVVTAASAVAAITTNKTLQQQVVSSGHDLGALCELNCQPNSHPFQKRIIFLQPNVEVKVGRSIARSRVTEDNAIFDCKVLSRNHAVIWYGNGKFYVKDTRSSNGTFINDRRISQSEPEELFSGDIVKFGVDVIENSRKEVHGCIIARVRLVTPDGEERLPNTTISGQNVLYDSNITYDELRKLQHLMQETSLREETLKIKLQDIQEVIELTRRNASSCWQAMIDEDRLLNRIDVLENKLKFLQKNAPDDELKDEILKLQEDKCLYQNSAKEALRKVYQERMEAVQKLTTIERALCSSEDECSLLRDQLLRTQQDLQEVSARLTRFENECKEHKANNEKVQNEVQKHDTETQEFLMKLKEKESELDDHKNQITSLLSENKFLQRRLGFYEKNENVSDDETLSKNSDTSSSNRGTVKKWLENSDLNHRDGSADIIKAICDDNDCYDEEDGDLVNLPELEKIQNNLHTVEKRLVQLNSYLSNDDKKNIDDIYSNIKVDDTTTSSSSSINDGNQNIQEENKLICNDAIKTNVTTLMEICNEIFEYATAVKSTKQFNKMHEDFKRLELKLLSSQQEINNLQSEVENRPTRNQLQEKDNINQYLEFQLNLAYEKITNLEQQISMLKENNELLENKGAENNGDVDYSKGVDISVGTSDLITSLTKTAGATYNDDSVESFIDEIIDSAVDFANTATNSTTTSKAIIDKQSKSLISSTTKSSPSSLRKINSKNLSITYPLSSQQNNHQHYTAVDNDNNKSDNNELLIDDKSILDDMNSINNSDIQHEEELIIFKEKYELILNENIKLKRSIDDIKQDYDNVRGRYLAKLFMYGTLIVILISYFVSLYNN